MIWDLVNGAGVLTTRQLAQHAATTVAEAERMLTDVLDHDQIDSCRLTPTFVVTYRKETAAVDGGASSVALCVKRFSSKSLADEFRVHQEGSRMCLHSVTLKACEGLPASQLIQKRCGRFPLAAGSTATVMESYPLLSRQATMEKAKSSGDLAPRSPLKPTEKVSPPVPVPALKAPATKLHATHVAPPATVHLVEPQQPTSGAAEISATVQTPKEQLHVATPPVEAERSSIPPAALGPEAKHDTATVMVAPVIAEAPPAPVAAKPTKPRTLFDFMKTKAPEKRERSDVEEPHPKSISTKGPAAPAAAAAEKKPRGRPAAAPSTNLSKLAKASAKATPAQQGITKKELSSMLLDGEEEGEAARHDSDDDDDAEERRRFLMQSEAAACSDAAESRAKRARRPAISAASLNLILPSTDDEVDAASSSVAADDGLELGDGANLNHHQVTQSGSTVPQTTPQKRAAPLIIAMPQKRPRDESAPTVPVGTALNAFFNADLIAFQKRFVKDSRTVQQFINGEFVFNDECFYRNIETNEELSVTEFQRQQRQIVEAFEIQKAASATTPSPISSPSSNGVQHLAESPAKPPAVAKKTHPIDTSKSAAPSTTKATAEKEGGPVQTTLFSFFKKKN